MSKKSGHLSNNVRESINRKRSAFTIVELLVVIVIIGILATIAFVSYSGIQARAITAMLISDLDSNSKLLKLYQVEHGYFPDSIDANNCPNAPTADNRYCLKISSGNTITYTGGGQAFKLIETHTSSGVSYEITESTTAIASSGGGSSTATFGRIIRLADGERLNAKYILQSSDGGYVVAGDYYLAGGEISQNYILKINSNGSLAWNKNWNVLYSSHRIGGIAQMSDGGYAMVGNTFGTVFVSEFSTTGALSWTKAWNGDNSLDVYSAARTTDDGFIIAGKTYNPSNDTDDLFMLKISAAGNISWSKIYASSSYETVSSVMQTSDGGYMAIGHYPNVDNVDMFALKTTSDGSVSWAKSWGTAYGEENQTAIQTADGGYLIGGYYVSSSSQAFLTKLNSDGSYAWNSILGNTAKNNMIASMVQNSDGTYTVIGATDAYQTDNADIVISKFTSGGVANWTRIIGSNVANEVGAAIAISANGGYAITGTTSGADGYIDNIVINMSSSGVVDDCAVSMCKTETMTSAISAVSISNASFTGGNLTISTATVAPEITSPTATFNNL